MIYRELPERTVAILNKGNTVIIVDDGCYVIRNWNGKKFGTSSWIFPEALEVLKGLPERPIHAESVISHKKEKKI